MSDWLLSLYGQGVGGGQGPGNLLREPVPMVGAAPQNLSAPGGIPSKPFTPPTPGEPAPLSPPSGTPGASPSGVTPPPPSAFSSNISPFVLGQQRMSAMNGLTGKGGPPSPGTSPGASPGASPGPPLGGYKRNPNDSIAEQRFALRDAVATSDYTTDRSRLDTDYKANMALMDVKAQQLGLDSQQLKANLDRGIESLNLRAYLDSNKIFDNMRAGSVAQREAAGTIMDKALEAAGIPNGASGYPMGAPGATASTQSLGRPQPLPPSPPPTTANGTPRPELAAVMGSPMQDPYKANASPIPPQRAPIVSSLQSGFTRAGRPDLAAAASTPAFQTWIQQESGWNPGSVSPPNNQGQPNGGLFQVWYGNGVRANTMSPEEQAFFIAQRFPTLTPARINQFAQQIQAGTYKGWG